MTREDDVRDDTAVPEPSGPAPIIDLGGDAVPVRPVKPLGPRRLARLQRELAERSRELEELGAQPAGPELLEKQRRFAELAAQAAAANRPPGGADTGDSGTAPAEPAAAGNATSDVAEQDAQADGPVVLEPGPSEPVDRITVVFPDPAAPGGAEGHPLHDPVHVDPGLFGNRLSPEELSALTHIEIVSPAEPAQPPAETPGEAPVEASVEPLVEVAADPTAETAGRPSADASAQPSSGEAPPQPPSAGPEEEPTPPAPPVPATRAGGLELLDPGEYRSGSRWPLVLLAVVLAAALVVLLVLFVL